jgi:hypothetical protein
VFVADELLEMDVHYVNPFVAGSTSDVVGRWNCKLCANLQEACGMRVGYCCE